MEYCWSLIRLYLSSSLLNLLIVINIILSFKNNPVFTIASDSRSFDHCLMGVIVLMCYGWFPASLSLSGKKKKKAGDECLSSVSNLGITWRLERGWLLLGNARQCDEWPWCGVMTLHLRRLFIKGQVVRWRLARLTEAAAMCPLCSISTSDAFVLYTVPSKGCLLWIFTKDPSTIN